MSKNELTDQQSEELLRIKKYPTSSSTFSFPARGKREKIDLTSQDNKESFTLHVRQGEIALKFHYVTNWRSSIILARIDLDTKPHRNPDGTKISGPHIHKYRQGYGDKWAEPLPANFGDPNDAQNVLDNFLDFCSIELGEIISRKLFV